MEYILRENAFTFLSPIEQVLINRGFNCSEISHYLSTTDADILKPELLINMENGVRMLVKHIQRNNHCCIIVDPDADGYTSAALLINYLYRNFPYYVSTRVDWKMHSGKQHGLGDLIDRISPEFKLVICPDSASNDYEFHKILQERGTDVLVLDHHEADSISDYACVINNQLCDYPTKALSGAGIVYKFCCFIDKKLGTNIANDYVDLAMLGIIADVMDLRPFEVKRIIDKGISNIRNPFIKGMVEKNSFSIGPEVTPIGIAFYVAPYVNGTIRVGTDEEKLMLFHSMLEIYADDQVPSTKRGHAPGETENFVDQAIRTCSNIKNRQTKVRDAFVEEMVDLIESDNLLDNKVILIKLQKSVDKNLTGLIANVLMGKYCRPILLLNKVVKDDGIWWEGSGRGCNQSKLTDFRGLLEKFGIFEKGGFATGHAQAFGFSIADKDVDDLIAFTNEELKDLDFSASYKVDFIFKDELDSDKFVLELAQYKNLWGQGIEEPLVAIEDLHLTEDNLTLMSPNKNPTLKISLPSGLQCIKFKSSEEEYKDLIGKTINLVGTCDKNTFLNKTTAQVLVKDFSIAHRAGHGDLKSVLGNF